MIESIEVTGFKTLRQVTIPLAPGITVLVGANNSGKSNILTLLSLLYAAARTGNLSSALDLVCGPGSALTRGGNGELKVSVRFREGGGTASYAIGLPSLESLEYTVDGASHSARRAADGMFSFPDGGGAAGPVGVGLFNWNGQATVPAPVAALHRALTGIVVRDLSVAALREPSLTRPGVELERDGRNLGAVLDDLNPDLRDLVQRDVMNAAPEVKRVLARNATQPGTKVVGVQELDGSVFAASEMSDGLVLFVGYSVSAALAGGGASLLALEEPERGVHPRLIRDLVDLLRNVSQQGRQVVLTTHSPELLNEFRDQPESVLILDRDESGTHVTRLADRPDWVAGLQDQPLGEIWYSGILGGVPHRGAPRR